MGRYDHIDQTVWERDELLRMLINLKRLDGAALGVAKKVLSEGEDALSDKQRYVYETHVVGDYTKMECRRCGNEIPLHEALCAKEDNDGYCCYCANDMAKDLARARDDD